MSVSSAKAKDLRPTESPPGYGDLTDEPIDALRRLSIFRTLTDREMHFWHQSMALADIVGVLQFVDGTLPDAELAPLLAPTEIRVDKDYHQRIRWMYRADDFQQLISGDTKLWDVPWYAPMPEARRDAISRAWFTLVKTYPRAFLTYRLENFGEILGVKTNPGRVVKGVKFPPSYGGQTMNVKFTQFTANGVGFELLEPLDGPSPWKDFIDKHGEGVHHIGFNVGDATEARMFLESQGGKWTQAASPTSAYIDMEPKLPITFEVFGPNPAAAPPK